jgi:SAM-dependent methyltransferase
MDESDLSRGAALVSPEDCQHWDPRYAAIGMGPIGTRVPVPVFAPYEHLFPTEGQALELACGRGRAAVWLAGRGMAVRAVDVSPVAIDLARRLAELSGVADRCHFEVQDLDDGLPEGPLVDLILCHLPHSFRNRSFDRAMTERLAPGGLLAVAAQSEVGRGPGPFRVPPGDLLDAFGKLTVVVHGEGDGKAWILARRDA